MKHNVALYKQLSESLKEHIEKLPSEDISYLKSGGRVNRSFKEGGKPKIHIKKENKGKFTDYCGGEVTSECISKGKNSSDPKIRKRATFAANARKWKH